MTKKKTNISAEAAAPRRNAILGNIVAPIGLMLILVATATPFFLHGTGGAMAAYPFIYLAGALVLLTARLFMHRPAASDRLKRLYRLETWSPAIFLVAIALLFYNPGTLRDWIAFTLAGAVLQIYTSWMIPAQIKREAKDNKNKE